MKKLFKIIVAVFLMLFWGSCAELATVINSTSQNQSISETEIVYGLKEALTKGVDFSIGVLGTENGFWGNELLKILLPDEANQIKRHIKKIPGGKNLVYDVELRMNRAAEDAVSSVGNIFKDAILSMSIQDATRILFGTDNAATQYLEKTTSEKLTQRIFPIVENSLDKTLVAGFSTNESWQILSTQYNNVANSIVGEFANMNPVNVSLSQHVTEKALEALFSKIAEEEKNIRKNPLARTSEILRKVFKRLDT